ncbi:hypothetical protein [Spirillospora albida]|nr:hypothetical protein [Spirillospora albida]
MKDKGRPKRRPMFTMLIAATFAAVVWREYPAMIRRFRTNRA